MNTAWTENYREELYRRLTELGYRSFLDYLREAPAISYEEISADLGCAAPIQLQRAHHDESESGDKLEEYMRDSFIRYLANHVPNGVKMHGDWPLNLALGSWAGSMDTRVQSRCSRIVKEFKKKIAGVQDDWIPQSNDPLVSEIFEISRCNAEKPDGEKRDS